MIVVVAVTVTVPVTDFNLGHGNTVTIVITITITVTTTITTTVFKDLRLKLTVMGRCPELGCVVLSELYVGLLFSLSVVREALFFLGVMCLVREKDCFLLALSAGEIDFSGHCPQRFGFSGVRGRFHPGVIRGENCFLLHCARGIGFS